MKQVLGLAVLVVGAVSQAGAGSLRRSPWSRG